MSGDRSSSSSFNFVYRLRLSSWNLESNQIQRFLLVLVVWVSRDPNSVVTYSWVFLFLEFGVQTNPELVVGIGGVDTKGIRIPL